MWLFCADRYFVFMYKITDLKQQQHNKKRMSVFLDNAFAFGLPTIVGINLKIGQLLSDDDIDQLQGEATIEAAKQSALHFISYRPRSKQEVVNNLKRKAYDEQVIGQTIDELERLVLVNDDQFAAYWVDQRETFNPRSQMALRQELLQKGISRDIIDTVIDSVDEVASARRAAEKRAGRWLHLPEEIFRVKIGHYLKNRGFYYGVIRQVTDDIWEEHMAMIKE